MSCTPAMNRRTIIVVLAGLACTAICSGDVQAANAADSGPPRPSYRFDLTRGAGCA